MAISMTTFSRQSECAMAFPCRACIQHYRIRPGLKEIPKMRGEKFAVFCWRGTIGAANLIDAINRTLRKGK